MPDQKGSLDSHARLTREDGSIVYRSDPDYHKYYMRERRANGKSRTNVNKVNKVNKILANITLEDQIRSVIKACHHRGLSQGETYNLLFDLFKKYKF